MKLESLSFRDRFDILLEKRLSDVAGLRYIMVYGKYQVMLAKIAESYGLEIVELRDVDLRKCYLQGKPDNPISHLLTTEDKMDSSLLNSPHYEFARLYFKKGVRWLKNNYETTKYYQMKLLKGHYKFPKKFSKLCNSMKKGYLRKGFNDDYIFMLEEPFAVTRYNKQVDFLVPEILSGHHRAAILLALEHYIVPVAIGKDIMPGACKRKVYSEVNELCT